MSKYRKSWTQALKEVFKKEVKVNEAVLVNRDYEYDSSKGEIHISKKNFKKVPKDFKNDTPGKERMITYDSKWGTVSVPVEFTEEVEVDGRTRGYRTALTRINTRRERVEAN